jgi:hypothetical protein
MKTMYFVIAMFLVTVSYGQMQKNNIYFNIGMGQSTLYQNPVSGESSGFNPTGTMELGYQSNIKNRLYFTTGLSWTNQWIYTRNHFGDLNGTTIVDKQPATRLNSNLRYHTLGITLMPQFTLESKGTYSTFIGIGYKLGYYILAQSNYYLGEENISESDNLHSLIQPWNHSFHADLTFWNNDKKSNIIFLNVFRVRLSVNLSGLSGRGELPYYNLGIMFGL